MSFNSLFAGAGRFMRSSALSAVRRSQNSARTLTCIRSSAAIVRPNSTSSPLRCFSSSAAASSSSSIPSDSVAADAQGAPLVAPAFGTNSDNERRFVYIKGVKNDGRSKRFYSQVQIRSVLTRRGVEYGVTLDERFVVTPYNQILSAPTLSAAMAIAFEWDSQGDYIRPISMPLSNICVTALDQAWTDRPRFLTHFRAAMKTDSVYLRVKNPAGLVSQQRKLWDPLLAWMKTRYNINLATTLEITTSEQSDADVKALQGLLESLNEWQLAALDSLTTVTKSFVISWGLLTQHLTLNQAFEAARLEENYQMRKYGQVDGVYGHGIEMEYTRLSISAAKNWINLTAPGGDPTKDNPLLSPNKAQ